MKVTIIPIVIGAFGTVIKVLLKSLEDLEVGDQVETIQTTALLETARILRRVLETWGDLLSLKLQWKTISLRWCEKLKWVINNICMCVCMERGEREREVFDGCVMRTCVYVHVCLFKLSYCAVGVRARVFDILWERPAQRKNKNILFFRLIVKVRSWSYGEEHWKSNLLTNFKF